jgi:hypothetical protein
VEWVRKQETERIKQGITLADEQKIVGRKMQELTKDIEEQMQKSLHGIFVHKRGSIDLN